MGNRYSPTVIVLAITGQVNKARLPTHVSVPAGNTGLQKDSVILAEQIRTLDKRRLRERIGSLPPEIMEKVSEGRARLAGRGAGRAAARARRGARREDDRRPGASTQEGDAPFLSQRLQCILSIRAASDTKILEKTAFFRQKIQNLTFN